MAFCVLAAAAIAVSALSAPAGVAAAFREPLVLALLGLGGLSAASAAWTIGEPADALRWGAVVGGFAAIAACGFGAARARGAGGIALVVAALAIACALLGVFGVAARLEPLAERVDGAWRAEGPLQYSPSLGLLELAALPLALRWMARRHGVALRGAVLGLLAGAGIGLVGTRTILALALLTLAAAVAWPRRTVGVERPLAAATAALLVSAAAGANAIIGSYAPPFETGGDLPRIAGIAAMLAVGAALWIAQRRCYERRGNVLPARRGRAMALAIVPLAIALGAAALTPDSGSQQEPVAGFAHGRIEVWDAAVQAGLDRPVAGSGALTFLPATLRYQDPPPTTFAHDLVLEEWTELGGLGAIAALLLLAFAVRAVFRARRDARWLLGPAVLGFAASSLLDWPWHVPASGAIFALAAGALAASRGAPTTPPETQALLSPDSPSRA